MKLIKITTDNEISVHEFPEGNYSEQNEALADLIGPKCRLCEHVMPNRLYKELGGSNKVGKVKGSCVSMLVDEEFLYHDLDMNGVGSFLYETDKHGSPIMGNILITVLSTAVQLLAGGKILSVATGLPLWVMTIVLAVIAFSYSQISGIKASVLTDAIQMIFLLLACAIFVPWALKSNGGMSSIQLSGITGEFGDLFSKNGLQVFLGFGLPTAIGLFAGPFGDQCFWQRAFSISDKKIGRAFSLGAVLFAVVPFSMGILGFVAAGIGFMPKDTGMVNFELIQALFPAWVIVPFMFMLISGLLSTVDSNLFLTQWIELSMYQTLLL